MPRLLRDRYFECEGGRAWDLGTGEIVPHSRVAEDDSPREPCPAALIELLEVGRDGAPRWVVAEARSHTHAAELCRRAAAEARARGFVAVSVKAYRRLGSALVEELRERTILLLGGLGPDDDARSVMLAAAALSARPHLLLTFRRGSVRSSLFACEARAVYSSPSPVGRSRFLLDAETQRHLARAARAETFAGSGRHAAAERLLRDVAGALTRRGASGPAAETLLKLGRLLLERGRVSSADKVFDDAARTGDLGRHEDAAASARTWQAAARTDAGRLNDAESICRAVLVTGSLSPLKRVWAEAILARTLLWQRRPDAAAALGVLDQQSLDGLEPVLEAWVHSVVVRVLLEVGREFEAGLRARLAVTRAGCHEEPLAHLIAQAAHLRILTAAGDLTLADATLRQVLELAKRARAPFRAARARLLWHAALGRAGRIKDARREAEFLKRLGRVAPPLLRGAIERQLAGPDARDPERPPPKSRLIAPPATAVHWVRVAQEKDQDDDAVRGIVALISQELETSRIELVSCEAGPPSSILAVGNGLRTTLGERIVESGLSIKADTPDGATEGGVPVRLGSRVLAALVGRWPLDRRPPADVLERFELAAAVLAPRLEALLSAATETARASTSIPELVGLSGAMSDVRKTVSRAAVAPFAVLVEGESGVGKELVARAIHQLSPRRQRRFCDVNCAALPDDLLDAELFGHARGAFTGAVAERPGLFEEADGGTLFLDEVADLSPRGQAKLLRVVQQHEIRRVGEAFSRKVDVRLVTAANRDMRRQAAEGHFRQDLLYRLDVIRIRVPALRERPEDVPLLAEHFWRQAASRVGSIATLSHGTLAALTHYHWPGNVRELQNVVAALAVAAPSRGQVRPSLLPPAIVGATVVSAGRLVDARLQFERRFVEAALARAAGSRTRAARDLGLSRQGLLKTMARLGIIGQHAEESTGSTIMRAEQL